MLLAIFTATLIPFHAFHKHVEDIHHVAVATKDFKNHHCKLDDNFCVDIIANPCKHEQHLAESSEKCFVGQYHFIKTIALQCFHFEFIPVFKSHYFEQKIVVFQNQFNLLLNNKGPPYPTFI